MLYKFLLLLLIIQLIEEVGAVRFRPKRRFKTFQDLCHSWNGVVCGKVYKDCCKYKEIKYANDIFDHHWCDYSFWTGEYCLDRGRSIFNDQDSIVYSPQLVQSKQRELCLQYPKEVNCVAVDSGK